MRSLLIMLVVLFCATDAQAQFFKKRPRQNYQPMTEYVERPTQKSAERSGLTPPDLPPVETKPEPKVSASGSDDALDEVNAERARLGLRPFIRDTLLTKGALACAKERAARQIHGHLSGYLGSDFDRLPSGAQATAAGCGALEPSWGWGTCCYTENYTYAGAAWVMGNDGRRYMHIFVR